MQGPPLMTKELLQALLRECRAQARQQGHAPPPHPAQGRPSSPGACGKPGNPEEGQREAAGTRRGREEEERPVGGESTVSPLTMEEEEEGGGNKQVSEVLST